MAAPLQRRFEVPGPLDLTGTLRASQVWVDGTWVRVDGDDIWFARRTEDGPGTAVLRREGDDVRVAGFGPGAERMVAMAPDLVGATDVGFGAIVPAHPGVDALVHRGRGVRLMRTGEVFPTLVAACLSQKVTGKSSAQSLRRIARTMGERAPGPRDDLWLLPTAERVAETPYWDFHDLGVEQHRAELLRRVARHAPAMERTVGMPAREAWEQLQRLPGVGPWTAAVVSGSVLGDADAVPIGDYHLPNFVAFHLAGEDRGDDARMLELLRPYVGHRGRLVRAIKTSGVAPPRFGPRMPIRDVRKMT